MKRLAIIAVVLMTSVAADAKTYRRGADSVTVPTGCRSYDCISVNVPGYYQHNVKPAGRSGMKSGRKKARSAE